MRFEPRFDAYRGVCITLVFLLHWALLDCGWIGVQAFFVLSGYLITGILRNEREEATPRRYFINFYARRSLRIFPLYFAYLVFLTLVANPLQPDILAGMDKAFNPALPSLLTYTYNFYRIVSGISSPFFSHLWSLSIEEQFYLVWPLVVLFLPRRRLLAACIAMIVAAPLIRWGEFAFQLHAGLSDKSHAGESIYYFTGSQLDAFAFGGLLTFRGESEKLKSFIRLASRWVPIAFAAASAWMLLLGRLAHYDLSPSSLGWPLYLPRFHASIWGYTLINALFFVGLANIHKLRALADVRILQRLGKVSYGFYIFHCPVIRLAKYFLNDPWFQPGLYDSFCFILTFAFTWGLAELSFRLFEQPILRLKDRFARAGDEPPDASGMDRIGAA